ncbi:HipA family kinase [Lentzea sp. BCCO 10_0061]|uniref:HipA family kinase n=1 Tax=Lentzea sokolovensis TaxID=3095429 RepID=A0ABU4VCU0_9PSEU|nr:HipA family kinase [Lentzea sp. BCCO 10_0061]MDX8149590.1 HipA family kinase [Lentzea sp. BCCO 10_0061]
MSLLREVTATRYVTPFREGGSMPGLVEADDLGMYVVKFRGAGQGVKVLVAEIVVGELARRLGFRIPEIVLVHLDPELARAEPDQEVQELLRASGGLNLGLDYLPGSFDFNPIVRDPGTELATKLLWFDALVLNVDRSWRNPNMLLWHREPWLIDHGAALYFHYSWSEDSRPTPEWNMRDYRYDSSDHAMLPNAGSLSEVDAELAAKVTPELLDEVLALVPDEWLEGDPAELRQRYKDFFTYRLNNRGWVDSLEAARAARV